MSITRNLRGLRAATISTVALTLLAVAPAANAAFPGVDGRVVVHDNRSIYTMGADGSAKTALPVDVPGFGGLSVSADGMRIAYSDSHEIYVVDADGSGQAKLTKSADGYSDDPTISPDGMKIAFTRSYGIWVMDVSGKHAHSITPAASFTSSYSDPAWSPDGSKIAFTLHQEIGVMSPDGSNAAELTQPTKLCPLMTRTMFASEPSWSPSGASIVFTGPVTCDFSRGTDIWTMHADGSALANLIRDESTDDNGPTYDPSGTRIAFRRDGVLQVMGADGSGLNAVGNGLTFNNDPDWGVAYQTLRITQHASARHVQLGAHVTIAGKVAPAQKGRVRVTVRRGKRVVAGAWVKLHKSKYAYTYTPKTAGSYSVVVTMVRGAHHLAATSPTRRFTVRAAH